MTPRAMSPAFEAWRNAGRAALHRGHPIFYRMQGEPNGRAALLCIHGFPTASWDWHELWPSLCERFECVIAPDMIGFGYSAKPAQYDYSIFDQADLLETLLRELGATRVHVLAHDYGDTVAQELLARHEDRIAADDRRLTIESCVFLNGGLFPETHRARTIQRLLLSPLGPWLVRLLDEAQFRRSFSAVFGPNTQPGEQALDEFWQLIAHNGGDRLFHRLLHYIPERRAHRARWVGVLEKTRVPLRFINGPIDPVSGAHMVARYCEVVPNADVAVLGPEIGHYPQVEAPEATLAAFLDFHARPRA